MEREVGGGIGMGNTCKPMAVSFQCMTKSTTNKKKKIFFNYLEIFCKKKKEHLDIQARFRKAKEREIRLPTFTGCEEIKKKKSTSASLITLKPLTVWITTNWKILKEMGISDHVTCLLRNLYAGEEATVRT